MRHTFSFLFSFLLFLSAIFLLPFLPAQSPRAEDVAGETARSAEKARAHVTLINNAGQEIGGAEIIQGTEGVLLTIKAHSLPPGRHGMHFHTKGTCEDLAHFKATGGHINPHSKPHGFLNPDGPHEGNLTNLIVRQDGTVEVELYTELVQVVDGPAALLDEDGSTLIIHTSPDDHFTQPIGGAGARIACGLLQAGPGPGAGDFAPY